MCACVRQSTENIKPASRAIQWFTNTQPLFETQNRHYDPLEGWTTREQFLAAQASHDLKAAFPDLGALCCVCVCVCVVDE